MDTMEDQPNPQRRMNFAAPKTKTAGAKIPNNYPGNAAIPLSDVQSGSTTYANNDMVGTAGQPVLPADVKKAAVQRRMVGAQSKLENNVPNTGWNNST